VKASCVPNRTLSAADIPQAALVSGFLEKFTESLPTKTGILRARQLWRTLLFISGLPTNRVTGRKRKIEKHKVTKYF
jgi:hypothetical protein